MAVYLILPTKKKWFDMLLSGEKPEEYREIKPYWDVRIAKWLDIKPTKENIEEIKRLLSCGNLSWIPSLKAKFINGYDKMIMAAGVKRGVGCPI